MKLNQIKTKVVVDENPDLSFLGEFSNTPGKLAVKHDGGSREYLYFNPANATTKEEAAEQYKSMLRFCRGDVCHVGVVAEASVTVEGTMQNITSGGLWGIQSDDKETIEETKKELIAELKKILATMGIAVGEDAEIVEADE